jgi:hypothetical protein
MNDGRIFSRASGIVLGVKARARTCGFLACCQEVRGSPIRDRLLADSIFAAGVDARVEISTGLFNLRPSGSRFHIMSCQSLALLLRRRFSFWRGRPLRLRERLVRRSGLTQAGRIGLTLRARLRSWLLWRAWPLRQAILPLETRLALRIGSRPRGIGSGSRRIGSRPGRVLLPLNAPLGNDLAADALGGVNLANDALVAQRLLWRDGERQRRKAPTGARPDRETAGSLGQKTKP